MNLPAKAASFALVTEVLLLPFLFVWQNALPLTHMPGFILVWDREPVFEFSAGGYVVMLFTNIAVLFVFWLLVLLLFRGGQMLFSRGSSA